jgi:hypothetical protein
MIQWTGFGILPVLLFLVAMFASSALDGPSVPGVRPAHMEPFILAAAALTYVLGKYLNRREVRHTLYGHRMENVAFAIVGLVIVVEVLMFFSPARPR